MCRVCSCFPLCVWRKEAGGRCPKGAHCGFAHSEAELRRLSPGDEAQLSAAAAEQHYRPQQQRYAQFYARPRRAAAGSLRRDATYKTRLCRFASSGTPEQCLRGDRCAFAHSEEELRPRPLERREGGVDQGDADAGHGERYGDYQDDPEGGDDDQYYQPDGTDLTALWKVAIYASRNSRARLRRLRDALLSQYRGRRLALAPLGPPPEEHEFEQDEIVEDDAVEQLTDADVATVVANNSLLSAFDERQASYGLSTTTAWTRVFYLFSPGTRVLFETHAVFLGKTPLSLSLCDALSRWRALERERERHTLALRVFFSCASLDDLRLFL